MSRMTIPPGAASPKMPLQEALLDLYRRETRGERHWLCYHWAEGAITPVGETLLAALSVCEARLPGSSQRFVRELAAIRYVATRADEKAWKQGFEQLVQKFAEILVARVLFEAHWPEGTTFSFEPKNAVTGLRPEIVIDTPDHQWLFEVKCPSFIDYQERRDQNPQQLPVRGLLGADPKLRAEATLPRDNVLKDFLASADRKFQSFSDRPRTGVLITFWDGYIFEATSALRHPEAGLLTPASWHMDDGKRVPFDAVEGVIVLNHLELLKLAAQEQPIRREDPFTIGGAGEPPNVWCANLGRGDLDPFVAEIFNAVPLADVAGAADYTPKDFVMWIDLSKPPPEG